MNEEEPASSYWWMIAVGVAAPFLPFLLAMIELVTLGTHRVEDFCRTVGLHEYLSKLYHLCFWFLR